MPASGPRSTPTGKVMLLLLCLSVTALTAGSYAQAQPTEALQLFIFNNGEIRGLAPELFNFTAEEVGETSFIVTSYLIKHPRGILLWDAGAVPDHELPADGSVFAEGPTVVSQSLDSQLDAVGVNKQDIDYFVMSHLHSDHNGNANDFADATWIVQEADRNMMFSGEEVRVMVASQFAALETAETVILHNEDYDVFGDGSVMILTAPGHTPGHQVLLVNLPEYGPVLLAGDLYHYPEEIATGRTPTFEYDPATTAVSRARIQQVIRDTGAQMWISHDIATHAKLNFAPAFYQ